MQHQPDVTRVAATRHTPSAPAPRNHRRLAGPALALTLARIWLVFAGAALLASEWLDRDWPALVLLATAIGMSAWALARSRPRPRRRQPLPNLSRASNCVWKMDIEG